MWRAKDSSAPTFANMINGQVNLRDAVLRKIDFDIGGKSYKLSKTPAVLIVRLVSLLSHNKCLSIDISVQTSGMAS